MIFALVSLAILGWSAVAVMALVMTLVLATKLSVRGKK